MNALDQIKNNKPVIAGIKFKTVTLNVNINKLFSYVRKIKGKYKKGKGKL